MPDYTKIYFHNIYEIVLTSDTTYTFSLRSFIDNPFFERPFGIITAYNPNNNTLSEEENLSKNQKLYNELNSKYELLEAKGSYKGHCEEGFLVFDITLAEAVEIGRRHEQFAIFYNSVKTLMYVDCEEKKVVVERRR